MQVPYELFLKEHLNYLISKLMAAEGEEQKEFIYSIKRVRSILNAHEQNNFFKNLHQT
jgi:hypothetical protein